MKAEIKENVLMLTFKSDKEMQIIFNWVKVNNGKFIMPDSRRELAPTRFKNLDIYIAHQGS